jgi:hypothetical protein
VVIFLLIGGSFTMKETKYRAWDDRNKKYVNIYQIQFQKSGIAVYTKVKSQFVKIKDCTLEQHTGLKDWWDGDIGEHPVSKERFVVKYNKNRGQWCAVYNGDQWLSLYMQIDDRGLAVKVGNIHEDTV